MGEAGRRIIAPIARWSLSVASLTVGLFLVAVIGPALDRRGLPGGPFAAVVLAILMLLSLRVLLGGFPPRGRRRMLRALASERGLRFRTRPRLPVAIRRMPSLSDPRIGGTDAWHLIAVPGDPVVLTFDRRMSPENPHEAPFWRASAACRVELDAPATIVEPRPIVTADPLGPLLVWTSESEGFARRYRIRTRDRRFASAFLDQRMLAWMLEQDGEWTFEVGGAWMMVSHADLRDRARLDGAVDLVRAFRSRIPSVAATMRPAP